MIRDEKKQLLAKEMDQDNLNREQRLDNLVKIFNEQCYSLLEKLPRAAPAYKKELLDVQMKFGSILMVSERAILENFAKLSRGHESSDDGIKSFILSKGAQLLKSDIINVMWEGLSERSKESVLAYVKVLLEAADEYDEMTNPPEEKDQLDDESEIDEKELNELWENQIAPFIHASVTGDDSKLSKIQKEALESAKSIMKEFETKIGRPFDPSRPEDVNGLKDFQKQKK